MYGVLYLTQIRSEGSEPEVTRNLVRLLPMNGRIDQIHPEFRLYVAHSVLIQARDAYTKLQR